MWLIIWLSIALLGIGMGTHAFVSGRIFRHFRIPLLNAPPHGPVYFHRETDPIRFYLVAGGNIIFGLLFASFLLLAVFGQIDGVHELGLFRGLPRFR